MEKKLFIKRRDPGPVGQKVGASKISKKQE